MIRVFQVLHNLLSMSRMQIIPGAASAALRSTKICDKFFLESDDNYVRNRHYLARQPNDREAAFARRETKLRWRRCMGAPE